MIDIVQILAGLGVVSVALAFAKYAAERRCWRRFKRRANSWVDRQVGLKIWHQEDPNAEVKDTYLTVFEKDVLIVVVEDMLNDAGFAPLHAQQLLEMSLLLVRGMAADKFLI